MVKTMHYYKGHEFNTKTHTEWLIIACNSSFRIQRPLQDSLGTHTEKNTCIHIIKNKIILFLKVVRKEVTEESWDG